MKTLSHPVYIKDAAGVCVLVGDVGIEAQQMATEQQAAEQQMEQGAEADFNDEQLQEIPE